MRIAPWIALAAVTLAACGGGAPPAPEAPAPVPPPPFTYAPVQLPPPVPTSQPVSVCVLRDGQVATVDAVYFPATGDTLVDGRPFREAHPAAPYAAELDWFVSNAPITVGGVRWVKYGRSRVLQPHDLERVGEHRGIPLFAEAGPDGTPEVAYVPVRPGCEFQPYMRWGVK